VFRAGIVRAGGWSLKHLHHRAFGSRTVADNNATVPMSISSRLLAAICLALLVIGCGERKPTPFEELYGGIGGPEMLHEVNNAEAYRVTSPPTTGPSGRGILSFSILEGPMRLTPQQANELEAALGDPSVLDLAAPAKKRCPFKPDVAVLLAAPSGGIIAVFSFDCDDVQMYTNHARTGIADFRRCRGTVVRLVQNLFPGDARIQQLQP